MPVTYKPTNVAISPFIRYSGTSAYNIYIKVETFGGCCYESLFAVAKFLQGCFRADCDHPRALPWKSAGLLQVSLRFSIAKFQFTVCATKAPLLREHSHGPLFGSSIPPNRLMPTTKIVLSQKSSRRRLNTGSVSNSRQEATPASAEVGPSPSSTPSVSLRGDAESAEVSSSLSGQTIMEITQFPFRQVISRKPLFSTRKPLF